MIAELQKSAGSNVLEKDDPAYRQCTLTVMDNIADPDIKFDDDGVCNYYFEYKELERTELLHGKEKEQHLHQLISTIRQNAKGKPYDCITGVIGGVDSSYLIYKIREWGLRPLIVH